MANFEESHDDSGERLELLVSSLITAFTVLSEELRETSNKPSAAHQAASPNNFETQVCCSKYPSAMSLFSFMMISLALDRELLLWLRSTIHQAFLICLAPS